MRWGIIGSGSIAATFAATISAMDGHTVAAVSSADPDRAAAFAARHGIDAAHAPHAALAGLGGVDAVYVATTNDRHLEDALACVSAGIPVLCEKPLTLDAASGRLLTDRARESGVFLMEAMWMRFLPGFERLLELVEAGTVGPPASITADFGFAAALDGKPRLLDPRLGGGALLDIGIYPLTLIHTIAGPPDDFTASAVLAGTGVDLQVGVQARHGSIFSSATASFVADTTLEAVVAGPEGRIRLHAPFHHSERITVERGSAVVETIDVPLAGSGYRFEVLEVARCLSEGRLESAVRPHADTLAVLDWMDAIRAEIGVAFPGEGVPPARGD